MELNSFAGQSFALQTCILMNVYSEILFMFPEHMILELTVCFEYRYIIVILFSSLCIQCMC